MLVSPWGLKLKFIFKLNGLAGQFRHPGTVIELRCLYSHFVTKQKLASVDCFFLIKNQARGTMEMTIANEKRN